jgi:polysaccharide biosynthesis/export protein VpsN
LPTLWRAFEATSRAGELLPPDSSAFDLLGAGRRLGFVPKHCIVWIARCAAYLSFWLVVSAGLGVMFGGCTTTHRTPRSALEKPTESTTIGPGDVFKMQIVGEKDLPLEYQVASDGTVDLPYIQRVHVAGLEPQEVQELIRNQLIEKQILADPSVVVSIAEFQSKRVTVLGEVQKPGSFPLVVGLTLLQAISNAGGLNAIADHHQLTLTRTTGGETTTVSIDFDEITEGRAKDVPLQAGDQIYVGERVF